MAQHGAAAGCGLRIVRATEGREVSHFDDLMEENRIMRECLEYIANANPKYAYASAMSHPDTNHAHGIQSRAKRALREIEKLQQERAGGSE